MSRDRTKEIDLQALRERASGQRTWRSLDELAGTPAFRAHAEAEFPSEPEGVGRRSFLRVLGASAAFAGAAACTKQPSETIVPYVRAPEHVVPGRPLFFATALPLAGYGRGVLVESHTGRPTKIEGNPEHPASLGATDVLAQADILSLYDPDRSKVPIRTGWPTSWSRFLETLSPELEVKKLKAGEGLRLLTGAVTSPALAKQIEDFLARFPKARWHRWEPTASHGARAGAWRAFGRIVDTQYRFEHADVVLSLDADFLAHGPACVRHARDFTSRRQAPSAQSRLNRLYALETTPTLTGASADHRLAVGPAELIHLAGSCASSLTKRASRFISGCTPPEGRTHAWVTSAVADLQRHAGRSIVIAGAEQPPAVHALAHAMNHALGNAGKTVIYSEPVEAHPVNHLESLQALAADMEAGKVDTLVIIDANPVYTAPADLGFAEKMAKVPLRVRLGLYEDETSALCHWHLPATHPLETWGDVRAFDGTVTIQQPLIAPLYDGRSPLELLAALLGRAGTSAHAIIQEYWKAKHPTGFAAWFERAVHDGVVEGTALAPIDVELLEAPPVPAEKAPPVAAGSVEVVLRPDPTVFDGSYANSGWLQELPKPLSKLTWDNAALVSPALAQRHNLANEDVVRLSLAGRQVKAPVWILPGMPDQTVALHLGYGRTAGGRVCKGAGFDAYALRSAEALWSASGLTFEKTGERYPLASTQHHHSMEGRHLVRAGSQARLRSQPDFVQRMTHDLGDASLYPPVPNRGHAWGMSIDLGACIGCNACVVACQAENSIPVVGKDQVRRGREMHWLRIDRYYQGSIDDPQTLHQPVPCMHCENAPCEPVCPVGATVHSDEGLNDMVYNRCVGTRYCSNNCPYKVRRFNFFHYADDKTESLKGQRNPDVTVRSRGVMEKCTYCVQRINAARINAKKENRKVRDGEIVTACQAVCPAQAITFGDIADSSSRVAEQRASPLSYGILTELNTRPRTTYMARITNPNPDVEG